MRKTSFFSFKFVVAELRIDRYKKNVQILLTTRSNSFSLAVLDFRKLLFVG